MTDLILTQVNTNEEIIKKSTFIGVCAPIQSIAEFESFLEQHQDLNATHNCWAYRLGNTYRFNDDGEPSGTAGKPILTAIEGAGFDHVAALVIRYYGGIKLGTGGLARAYGGTIAKNLRTAPSEPLVPQAVVCIRTPFAFSQMAFKILDDFATTIKEQSFNDQGLVCVAQLAKDQVHDMASQLNNACKGQSQVQELDR